jgi:hypothetical protein
MKVLEWRKARYEQARASVRPGNLEDQIKAYKAADLYTVLDLQLNGGNISTYRDFE